LAHEIVLSFSMPHEDDALGHILPRDAQLRRFSRAADLKGGGCPALGGARAHKLTCCSMIHLATLRPMIRRRRK
jgi:hypothetical protein